MRGAWCRSARAAPLLLQSLRKRGPHAFWSEWIAFSSGAKEQNGARMLLDFVELKQKWTVLMPFPMLNPAAWIAGARPLLPSPLVLVLHCAPHAPPWWLGSWLNNSFSLVREPAAAQLPTYGLGLLSCLPPQGGWVGTKVKTSVVGGARSHCELASSGRRAGAPPRE